MRNLTAILCLLLSYASWGCSALVLTGKTPVPLIAVNLDWPTRDVGLLVIHPRHQAQSADVNLQLYHPLTWTSRYGSVMFHAMGSAPHTIGPAVDGMNEKGLTASVLILNESEYEVSATKPALNVSLWIRYILDNFQSVQEVIENLPTYQLVPETYRYRSIKLHLLIHDQMGHQAILEYLEGKLSIHQEDNMPYPVLTNSPYEQSLHRLSQYHPFGGTAPLPGEYDSISRFVRASATIKRLPAPIPEEDSLAFAFNALADVAQPIGTQSVTQISMVFDMTHLSLYFRTINEAMIRYIKLSDIDFDTLDHNIEMDGYQHSAGNLLQAAEHALQ